MNEPLEPGAARGQHDGDAEPLEIERRLRAAGYAMLPTVLGLGGDFDYSGSTPAEIVAEAQAYLIENLAISNTGAHVLAAVTESAIKAQAFDAIVASLRRARRPQPPTDPSAGS